MLLTNTIIYMFSLFDKTKTFAFEKNGPGADLGGGGTGGTCTPPLEKRLTRNMCKDLPTYFSHILYRAPISPCTLAKILGHSKRFFSLAALARLGNPYQGCINSF